MTLQCLIAAFWVEQRSHSFAIDEHPPLLLGFSTRFCLRLYSWDKEAALCRQVCVISVLLGLSNTTAGLKGHWNHTLTSVSFPETGEFQERKQHFEKTCSPCTSLLSITECSVAPLHPDAKLSKEHQWLPCDKTQFGLQHWQERTLKATEETNTTTGCGSVCRNNPEFYRQVFLFIYNAVKAVLAT